MRTIILAALVAFATSACGCLPNPQSEWVTSEGGEQRSTLDDATIQSASCAPDVVVVDDDGDGWNPTTHVHVAHRSHSPVHIAHSGHAGGGHHGHH